MHFHAFGMIFLLLAATAVLEDQGGEMGDLGDEEDPGEVMLI